MELNSRENLTNVLCLFNAMKKRPDLPPLKSTFVPKNEDAIYKTKFLEDIAWVIAGDKAVPTAVCLEENPDNQEYTLRFAREVKIEAGEKESLVQLISVLRGNMDLSARRKATIQSILAIKRWSAVEWSGYIVNHLSELNTVRLSGDRRLLRLRHWGEYVKKFLSDPKRSILDFGKLESVLRYVTEVGPEVDIPRARGLWGKEFNEGLTGLMRCSRTAESLTTFAQLYPDVIGRLGFPTVPELIIPTESQPTEPYDFSNLSNTVLTADEWGLLEEKDVSDDFPLVCETTWDARTVHPEMKLLIYYEIAKDSAQSRSPWPYLNYIGTSELSCRCCHLILLKKRFHVSGCSRKIDSRWSVPPAASWPSSYERRWSSLLPWLRKSIMDTIKGEIDQRRNDLDRSEREHEETSDEGSTGNATPSPHDVTTSLVSLAISDDTSSTVGVRTPASTVVPDDFDTGADAGGSYTTEPSSKAHQDTLLVLSAPDAPWHQRFVALSGICDPTGEPSWAALIEALQPADQDSFDAFSGPVNGLYAIVMENKIVVWNQEQFNFALKYFRNEARLNIHGVIVQRCEVPKLMRG